MGGGGSLRYNVLNLIFVVRYFSQKLQTTGLLVIDTATYLAWWQNKLDRSYYKKVKFIEGAPAFSKFGPKDIDSIAMRCSEKIYFRHSDVAVNKSSYEIIMEGTNPQVAFPTTLSFHPAVIAINKPQIYLQRVHPASLNCR